MKKLVLAVTAVLAAFGAIAQSGAPVFEGENGFVIDVSAIYGKFKDNVLVVNKTQEQACAVKVFVDVSGTWQEIGAKSFTSFDETVKIKAKKTLKFADCRYVAVQALNGFAAVYKATKENNDLIIEVRSAGSDLAKPVYPPFPRNTNAFLFDAKALNDEADENLKITGYISPAGEVTFRVSAYDADKKTWILWGTADIGHNGDTEKVKGGKHGDLDDYRYFAVEALDGKEYKYMPLVQDDDLFINVSL